MYQPKTGQPCGCRPGVQRDNCSQCEGTGQRIDFAAIRNAAKSTKRRRVIERATREQAEGLAQRLMLEGKGVGVYAPDSLTSAWRVEVSYQDGEQAGLPLGVQDGPA